MNLYNKHSLDSIAKEQGFIRDNLEKVMRLVDHVIFPPKSISPHCLLFLSSSG